MATASERTELIVFERATVAEDGYGGEVETWNEYATRRAKVRFGTSQEKREAAQEGGIQAATFECYRSSELDAVTLRLRIVYDGSNWDITGRDPLSRKDIRFAATRNI